MTDSFAPSFQIVPLAPLSPAPSAPSSDGGGSGAGLGHRISNDWSARKVDNEARTRKERRSAVAKARAKVESRDPRPTHHHQTKSDRLAAAKNKLDRDTGSPKERVAVKSSVQRAAAALAHIPSDKEFSTAEARHVREILRQRYPGASLSSMLQEGARLEQMLIADPVNAYEILMAAYSRAKATPGYVEPKHSHGTRGSIQRAQQDQKDAEDLQEWTAKYGSRLPQILAELEFTDRNLHQNPSYAAAKLAARHGAPAIESEIAPYEAQRAAKAHYEQRMNSMMAGIQLAIEHGIISGDEEDLLVMADVLAHEKFPWDEHRRYEHFELRALHHAHTVAQQLKQQAGKPGKRSAGSKSISGAASAGHVDPRGPRTPGTGGVRDSIQRAQA